ncbi:MAG: aldehyde dehydrogenase [Oscillospiraceae bacterium]
MNFNGIVNLQREYFKSGATKSYDTRIKSLLILKNIIINHQNEIELALKKDLNKSPTEAFLTEISTVLDELSYMIKNLSKLMKNKSVSTPIVQFYSKSFISPEPYGVTLIMSPWNYPFYLTFAPLIGALAAGNTVIIKPSDYAANTSALIKTLIETYFPPKYVSVVIGGREENKALLEEKYDYIFFTGSPSVGKLVMTKAAVNLTPISLELGGKSPCIIDKTANIKLAAKRIAFGKHLNAGQTCIAPDYILIDKSIKNEFIRYYKQYVYEFFGEEPLKSNELCKIINEKHFNRLINLMKNETIVFGGEFDENTRQISPTLLDNITFDSKIMQEEIFGPIMPLISFNFLDEALDYITSNHKPLALYLFSNSKVNQKNIMSICSFGGGCINDTIMHIANSNLPFGGVGNSGMGAYHGKYSFDTFSHFRGILKKTTLFDIPLRYYPYDDTKSKLLRKILK